MNLASLSRPMRAAGLGLLGVAMVATVIGTASVISSDDPAEDTAVPTDTPDPAPSPTEPDGGPELDPPEEEATPDEQDPDEEDPDAQEPDEQEPEEQEQDQADSDQERGQAGELDGQERSMPVRVYNNSDVDGLAARAGEDLRDAGWNITEFGNYSDGIVPESTVYFRENTDEAAVAQALGREFGMRVEPRFEGLEDSTAGVIVILTRDYDDSDKEN